jgi:hypothetical protein
MYLFIFLILNVLFWKKRKIMKKYQEKHC